MRRLQPSVHDRDAISARWSAHDDNDDELVYSVYYRGDNETQWRLLKDKISDKYLTWDAGLFPDGGYTIQRRSLRRALSFSRRGLERR